MKHRPLPVLFVALIGVLPSTGRAIVASIEELGIDTNGTN